MSIATPQAIAGVSAGYENVLETVYPSVASTGLGRFMARYVYDSIPLKINGIRLSHLLFTLPTSFVPLILYFHLKLFGRRYVLTNRAIAVWRSLGERLISRVPLADVAEITIDQQPGQEFYTAGDLYLLNSQGETLLRLDGVRHPARFRQLILDTRDVHLRVQQSLATIEGRQSA